MTAAPNTMNGSGIFFQRHRRTSVASASASVGVPPHNATIENGDDSQPTAKDEGPGKDKKGEDSPQGYACHSSQSQEGCQRQRRETRHAGFPFAPGLPQRVRRSLDQPDQDTGG